MNQLSQLNETLRQHVPAARAAMKSEQYYFLPEFYEEAFCASIRKFMDDIAVDAPGVERYYGDSERRIWASEKRCPEISRFKVDADAWLSAILEKPMESGNVLAIRNQPIPADGNHVSGRWHIDSWRSQEKVFLFLNDTNEESGAFEFIPGTHRTSFRLRKAFVPGFFFNPLEMIFHRDRQRPYQSIADEKIRRLTDRKFAAKKVICKAGSLLVVNPSYLIHRASPCLSGNRYALTAYYETDEDFKSFDLSETASAG